MRIGAQVGDAFTDDKSEYGLMMAGTVLAIVPILVRHFIGQSIARTRLKG